MKSLSDIIIRLQAKNEKAYSLALLRVAICLWFIKEFLFRWSSFDFLYSGKSFLKLQPTYAIRMFRLNIEWLREHHMLIIWICLLLLLLNLFGIGRNLVSILLFLALTLLYHMNNNFSNAGDEMAMLLFFFLSLSNSYSYFTLFKPRQISPDKEKLYNLISNLAAYSIMINLCLAYFTAGIFKLLDPYWQQGTGLYYFINDDRYSVLAAGGKNVQLPQWFLIIFNYGTILLELAFPVLVWFKKYRTIIFSLCLIMHAGIYAFLMIYSMTVVFVIQYCIFYPDEQVMAVIQKIKLFFGKLFSFARK